MIMKYVYIFFIITFTVSANTTFWDQPKFTNLTLLNIDELNIETKAQKKSEIVKFTEKKTSKSIKPLEAVILSGRIGGEFEVFKEDHNTDWNISLLLTAQDEKKYFINESFSFSNMYTNGPALSFWPKTKEINHDESEFILIQNLNEDTLTMILRINADNEEKSIEFMFNLYEPIDIIHNKSKINYL